MSKMKIYIEIKNGCIQMIESNQKDFVDIIILDYDRAHYDRLYSEQVHGMDDSIEKAIDIFLETGENTIEE